jgi:hypothetical protein
MNILTKPLKLVRIAVAVGVLVIVGALMMVPHAPASAQTPSGPSLFIGNQPGLPAQFTDLSTGQIYQFRLVASEYAPNAGAGNVTLVLAQQPNQPTLGICSTHGPEPDINRDFDSSNNFEAPNASAPLSGIQCGTAGGMSVALNGCVADIELHGFIHSDHPRVTYIGMMTLDLHFDKTIGEIDLTAYTPKEAIKLKGNATGAVAMSTCT